jgi:hypothetical protein
MAAAIEKRQPARIVDELEVGAVFENFVDAALGIDVGVDVDNLSGRHGSSRSRSSNRSRRSLRPLRHRRKQSV